MPSLDEIYNPSWSPDGARVVFSALHGGLSDLFVFTTATQTVERLTTDAYPADFGWTPDWRRPGERIGWWYHNLGSVTVAAS